MSLQKQAININFSQGIDTKTDPKQVPVGKFLQLENITSDIGGLAKKRYGFKQLTTLSNDTSRYIATYQNDLTAIGNELISYSAATQNWKTKDFLKPISVQALPVIRNNSNQSQPCIAVSDNLTAITYTEGTSNYHFTVVDNTNQGTLAFNNPKAADGGRDGDTVEELRPAIKASITNLMNRLLSTNPLAVTVSNQQFITACVSLQGCVKVNVTVSVNGGSFTSNDLSFAELEYPVVRNFNIT